MEGGAMSEQLVIAIDGPSGSGKSSVAKAVARTLGLAYLDTGAMYRAATWWCLRQRIDLADGAAVLDAVAGLPLDQRVDPDDQVLAVAGTEVTEAIRDPEVSTAVSRVATNLDVRALLVAKAQAVIAAERDGGFSGGRGIVVEGRDITTVVAPDAPVRLLLTASAEARVARRAKELHGDAGSASVAATTDQVLRRDADDSTVVEFQAPAPGVAVVDSTHLDLEGTVAAVLAMVPETTRG
jgi:CMP/dCMP kinase